MIELKGPEQAFNREIDVEPAPPGAAYKVYYDVSKHDEAAEENEALTRTGAGTLMGDLMRQYWLPFLYSWEIEPDGRRLRRALIDANGANTPKLAKSANPSFRKEPAMPARRFAHSAELALCNPRASRRCVTLLPLLPVAALESAVLERPSGDEARA